MKIVAFSTSPVVRSWNQRKDSKPFSIPNWINWDKKLRTLLDRKFNYEKEEKNIYYYKLKKKRLCCVQRYIYCMIYDPPRPMDKLRKKILIYIWNPFWDTKEIKKKIVDTDYIIITLWTTPKKQEIYSFRSFQLSSFLQ